MTKKIVFLTALALAGLPLVYTSSAQDFTAQPAKASIQEYGPFKMPSTSSASRAAKAKNASGTCGNPAGPCLFYGADFIDNPLWSPVLPNGLANENDLVIGGSPYGGAVWVPFTVPEGKGWKVTGLFTNNQATYGVLDQTPNVPASAAYYSVNQDVAAGAPGVVIAAGIGAATSTPTGRSVFGMNEYTVQVTGLSFELAPGNYWMIVVPYCTNAANPYCNGRFFLSDVEYVNVLPVNAFGPDEPQDAAYLDGANFGAVFEPTAGSEGACFGDGCDAFSAGVIGTDIKGNK